MAKGWIRRSTTVGCIAVATFSTGGVAYAQGAAAPAAPAAPAVQEATLKVGDKAPPLTVETWIKGDEVKGFEQNKTYVIEFWATWCGPCIVQMPHLSEIQKHYKSKGLTVIGMTSKDTRGNTFERAKAMVADKGDTMGYTVAWDKERTTNEAYMKAAQRGGIPCSFVIDGKGNVAWIGHPMFLDIVLDKVVAGTWDYQAGPASVDRADGIRKDVFMKARSDPKAALAAFATLEKDYPALAENFSDLHSDLLIRAGEYEKGYKIAGKVVDEAIARKDAAKLNQIATNIVAQPGGAENANLDLAMKAAEKASEFTGGKDPAVLTTLSRVYILKGEFEKGYEIIGKLVDEAIAKKDSARLNQIAWNIVDPKGSTENKNLDVAMKAAVKASEFTEDKDPAILDTLARVHFLKGDTAKAIEIQTKALELAEEGMKAELQEALDEYKAKAKKHD